MRLLIVALLLALPLAAAGPHYIDCDVAGTGTGTLLDPWKTVTTAIAHTFEAGDFLYIKRGCSSTVSLNIAQSGSEGAPITVDAYGTTGAMPAIAGVSSTTIILNAKNYITIKNINLSGGYAYVNNSVGVRFENCIIQKAFNTYGLYIGGAADVVVNNSLITQNGVYGVYLTGAGTKLTIRNSAIVGNGQDGSVAGYGVNISTGAEFDYGNTFISGNGRGSANWYLGAGTRTDSGGNTINGIPGWRSYKTTAAPKFVIVMDGDGYADVGTRAHAYAATTIARPFTVGLSYMDLIPSDQKTILSALPADHGTELASHSYSHQNVTLASMFTATTTNSGTNTITIDRDTSTITLTSSGNPENDKSYTWTATNTLCEFKQYIQPGYACSSTAAASGGNWTITNTSGVSNYVRMKALDEQTSTTFPYLATYLMSALYASELDDSATWMTTNLSVTPTTLIWGGGYSDAASQAYAASIDTTFHGSRGASGGTTTLSSVTIHKIWGGSFAIDLTAAADEATTRAFARRMVTFCKATNSFMVMFFHSSLDVTDNQLGWYVNEVEKWGGTFVTFAALVDAIRADHDTADDETWTKTYTDATDARLANGSALIKTGADLGTGTCWSPKVAGETLNPDSFGWSIGPYCWIRSAVGGN